MFIEILNIFFIPSIENWFSSDVFIFRDDNAPFHRAKGLKFLKTYKTNVVTSEQIRSKSNWKFMVEFFSLDCQSPKEEELISI